jgi:HJR/Mrr/RecB family endonuclease
MPGAIVLALAAVVYGGVGLALPVGLGLNTAALVALNLLGATWGCAITVAKLVAAKQASDRRLLLELTTDLRLLSASQFEWLVGEVLRREGWNIEETGRTDGPDGNVDLVARRGAETRLVQCKRWKSQVVGVDEVRKLAGTLVVNGLAPGGGVLVTLSEFSPQAVSEAQASKVTLVNGRDLLDRVERVRAAEPCPQCGTGMILDRSARGWWLRCPRYSEGCDGKRDLGADPGAAVDLLLAR